MWRTIFYWKISKNAFSHSLVTGVKFWKRICHLWVRADTLQIFSSNLRISSTIAIQRCYNFWEWSERDNGLMCIKYICIFSWEDANGANWRLTKSVNEVVKLNTETERQGIRIKIKEKLNSENRKQVLSVNMCFSLDFRLNLHNDIKCCYLKTYNRVCFHNVHISKWIMNLNYKCSTMTIKTSNCLFFKCNDYLVDR